MVNKRKQKRRLKKAIKQRKKDVNNMYMRRYLVKVGFFS